MAERAHLSIGEVLNLLQEEFPDITISKIRFLESQGLLDPERTPSGYRKFYDGDIERLRWILRQQRENFLPLKVIKDRLAAGELDGPAPGAGATAVAVVTATAEVDGATDGSSTAAPGARATAPRKARRRQSPASLLDIGETSVRMSVEELVNATGLNPRAIAELERYGLLASHELGNVTFYDDDALLTAKLAASFMRHGVEPRHLRMYKVSAERETGVFEQLVMPMLKQRNPATRQEALELLTELSDLGEQLRASMLRQALREYLGPA
jgi:DNA-binding transcriptional MerR regulator